MMDILLRVGCTTLQSERQPVASRPPNINMLAGVSPF